MGQIPSRAPGGLGFGLSPLHGHPVPACRFNRGSHRASAGAGCADFKVGRQGPGPVLQRPRPVGAFIQRLVCRWQAAQPEPAATHVPRSMAQPLRARGSPFPHCHGLEAQWEVAGSGSPSPPLGGGNLWLPQLSPALERGAPGRGAGGSSGGPFWQRGISCWIAGLAVPKNKASPGRQRGAQMAGAWGPGVRPSQDAGACALQQAVHSHPSQRALCCQA